VTGWFWKRKQGLSEEFLAKFENHLKIPMSNLIRSFNIANSVALSSVRLKANYAQSKTVVLGLT
jgi:tRNA(Leu) C34 or U34 (ribose-2'-O)-methylase TrmL